MTDINQMNINQLSYDQQAFKMMTHLWNMDSYGYNPDQKSSAINSFAYFNSLTNQMPLRDSTSPQASKRKQKKVPDEEKDESYYERRKKNNESARRSREQRRRKEEDNAKGLEFLRVENERLRQEMHRLYAEIQRLRGLVGSNQTFGWPAPTS